MTLTTRTVAVVLFTTLTLLLAPSLAAGEYLVPEGNSAVSQYTEGVPSASGEEVNKGGNNGAANPGQAIGAGNAKKLEGQGQEGREAAEVAAATAPATSGETNTGGGSGEGSQGNHAPGHKHGGEKGEQEPAEGGGALSSGGGAATGGGPGGSSGLGSVLAAAAGLESGNLGLLLPLSIVAALVWGILYALRQRRRPAVR